jgi:hypothetical protein
VPKGQTKSKPIVRSMREVADAFGVEQRAIAQWKAKGMPCTQMSGDRNFWYDLDEIYDWRVAYLDALTVTDKGKRIAPAISEAMPHMGELGAKVEEFKITKADVMSAGQMEALANVNRIRKLRISDATDEQILAWTVTEFKGVMHEEMLQFAIGFDKEALERSKGVDNVSKILGVIKQLKDMDGQGTGDNGV